MKGYWKKIPDAGIKHCFLKEVTEDFREKYESNPDKLFKEIMKAPSFWKRLFHTFF